jgi:hypothetical protein
VSPIALPIYGQADALPVYGRPSAAPQEALRHSLQTESQELLRTHRQEEEEQLLRAEREREALRDEARSLQRDRDLSLLQAETEKQQVFMDNSERSARQTEEPRLRFVSDTLCNKEKIIN